MDKSGAYVDSVYQALFSRRAGDEARYSHNCLARIKKNNNDLATFDIPTPPPSTYRCLHDIAWCCMQVTHIFTYRIYANITEDLIKFASWNFV